MTRLILLNGPPGSGKSTMARWFVDAHPLTLNLDIDQLRSCVGGWRDRPLDAGLLARSIALAAARVHLAAGHDVIIPQHLGRLEFVGQLEGVAAEAGATFLEVVLTIPVDEARRRLAARRTSIHHPVTDDELTELCDRLDMLVAVRPQARTVVAVTDELDATYQALLSALG